MFLAGYDSYSQPNLPETSHRIKKIPPKGKTQKFSDIKKWRGGIWGGDSVDELHELLIRMIDEEDRITEEQNQRYDWESRTISFNIYYDLKAYILPSLMLGFLFF